MLSSILGFLTEFWPYLAGMAIVLGAFLKGQSSGKSKERSRSMEIDNERAAAIEERVDAAIENNDSDDRPVDERLHSKGHLRD